MLRLIHFLAEKFWNFFKCSPNYGKKGKKFTNERIKRYCIIRNKPTVNEEKKRERERDSNERFVSILYPSCKFFPFLRKNILPCKYRRVTFIIFPKNVGLNKSSF